MSHRSLHPSDSSLSADSFDDLPILVSGIDFRAVVEASTDLLTVLTGDGRILYDNPAVRPMLGYEQGELVGSNAFELIHPDDYPTAVALLSQLASGVRSTASLAFGFRDRQGGWRRLACSGQVMTTVDGTRRIVVTSRVTSGMERVSPEPQAVGDPVHDALSQARIEVVERLARAAEYRDDDTGQHQRRVGELAARLATALQLPVEEVEEIRRAAPLHDVGKIGIPDAILLKPGPLLPEEESVMRTHPILGARILSGGSTSLLRTAEQIALCHHEQWNGGGYPRGIEGEGIPCCARIVAIVDVFDALHHDRPYRAAWPRHQILNSIQAGKGSRFDPTMTDHFLRLMA